MVIQDEVANSASNKDSLDVASMFHTAAKWTIDGQSVTLSDEASGAKLTGVITSPADATWAGISANPTTITKRPRPDLAPLVESDNAGYINLVVRVCPGRP